MEQPVTYRPSQGLTLLYAVAAVVVVIWGMREAAPLLIEVLLAIFIAIVCAPSLYWLQKKGFPAWLSLVVVITVLLLIAFGFIVLMGSSIASFSANLAHYKKTLTTTYQGVLHFLDNTHIIEILENDHANANEFRSDHTQHVCWCARSRSGGRMVSYTTGIRNAKASR